MKKILFKLIQAFKNLKEININKYKTVAIPKILQIYPQENKCLQRLNLKVV